MVVAVLGFPVIVVVVETLCSIWSIFIEGDGDVVVVGEFFNDVEGEFFMQMYAGGETGDCSLEINELQPKYRHG